MTTFSETRLARRRLGLLLAGSIVVICAIGARLVQLQIFDHGHYLALAKSSQSHKYEVPAKRGQIYVLDGDQKSPLVLNQTLHTIYADPRFVSDKVKTAQAISAITGASSASYEQAMAAPGDYVVLARKVSDDQNDKIAALKLSGIGSQDENYRLYPEGSLASQLLGFVNSEGKGQYGLEAYLDKDLAGTPGQLNATTDINGIPIATANNLSKPPVDGNSYVLTIDRNIQAQAEKYLAAGVQAVGAASGSVVVIDPTSGAVKAMANYPTYDPSDYSHVSDFSLFSNSVTSNAFEPGSGFKTFTMATGLDTGKVTPSTTYNDTGSFEVNGYTIKNSENRVYGSETMSQVILRSLNTGVMFVLRSLGTDPNKITKEGKQVLYDYLTNHFAFGVKTGIEQAGESAGRVNSPKASDVNYANMTFGQGLSITMMQMVQAYVPVANGGTMYQPYLIDQVIHPDGSVSKTQPRVIKDHVISAATAAQLAPMLEAVVDSGTGRATKIAGYKIAGKTGTAQVPKSDGSGYDPTKNIGSFTGFAPVGDPKFVMMVRINEPKTPGFAESTTVPVFGNIATWLLRYLAVPPSS
ncbi:MAG TPA: penicillin-binding protein 2 [Candidatus Saccharimonadales bacterium]|nr:penicillin-binding protein 2 [Candidatus Saccharimonadales bacterium]